LLPNLNSLIDRFASAFRIETEIVEEKDTIHLKTFSYIGTRLLYEHTLDLSPVIDIAVRRAADAAETSVNPDSSQESQ
jgi:hypothetical protein